MRLSDPTAARRRVRFFWSELRTGDHGAGPASPLASARKRRSHRCWPGSSRRSPSERNTPPGGPPHRLCCGQRGQVPSRTRFRYGRTGPRQLLYSSHARTKAVRVVRVPIRPSGRLDSDRRARMAVNLVARAGRFGEPGRGRAGGWRLAEAAQQAVIALSTERQLRRTVSASTTCTSPSAPVVPSAGDTPCVLAMSRHDQCVLPSGAW
jgi:hypothetical protein